MSKGKVKWYDKKKGYGFIAEENGGDIFVHYTSFSDSSLRTLSEGEEVVFETVQGEKGPKAQNLSLQPN